MIHMPSDMPAWHKSASTNMSDRNSRRENLPYKKAMKEEQKKLAVEVGRRLGWVRELTGRTQEEMLTEASQGQWSRWETGERLIPSVVAIEVCNRLRISMDYIYRGHLLGVHPELAKSLWEQHPRELVPPPIYTGWGKGMDLA